MPAPSIDAIWAKWPQACAAPVTGSRVRVVGHDEGVELAEDADRRAGGARPDMRALTPVSARPLR